MKLVYPRSAASLLQNQIAHVSRDWSQWFRGVSTALGFWPQAPMHSEILVDALGGYATGGATGFVAVAAWPRVRGFNSSQVGVVYYSLHLPNNLAPDSDVVPFVEWCPTTTGAGGVVWQIYYSIARNGSVASVAVSESVTGAASGVDDQCERETFTAIDGTTLQRGDTLLLRLSRELADPGDTYASTAGLIAFGIKCEVAALGHEERFA